MRAKATGSVPLASAPAFVGAGLNMGSVRDGYDPSVDALVDTRPAKTLEYRDGPIRANVRAQLLRGDILRQHCPIGTAA